MTVSVMERVVRKYGARTCEKITLRTTSYEIAAPIKRQVAQITAVGCPITYFHVSIRDQLSGERRSNIGLRGFLGPL